MGAFIWTEKSHANPCASMFAHRPPSFARRQISGWGWGIFWRGVYFCLLHRAITNQPVDSDLSTS